MNSHACLGVLGTATAWGLAEFHLVAATIAVLAAMHELDRIPNVLKSGRLLYPGHLLRRGLEGKVKLRVLIDERGTVKVQEVINSSHPDFVEPSIRAAEESTYEPPLRNGKNVKVQFFLPLEFMLSE